MKKTLMKILLGFIFLLFLLGAYLFLGKPPLEEKIIWGVNFSQKHAQLLGLDWQENYLALLDDLKVKNIKLLTHWDLLEPEKDKHYFNDLDWQIEKAEERGANIVLVMGMKTGRWPECHLPEWVQGLNKEDQQKEILQLLEQTVKRYRDRASIEIWQVENEPFFPFGECPWSDKDFLAKEVDLVKSLDDQQRPVIVSDSGEGSFWTSAAQLGDMVGTTLHRIVWFKELKTYVSYPFPPIFYWRKAQIIKTLFNKEVICVELQAEPWGPKLLYDSPLEEQLKTMNLEQFKENIEFARKTGLKRFYFWGSEWWYWMKEKQEQPEIWKEAKILFE